MTVTTDRESLQNKRKPGLYYGYVMVILFFFMMILSWGMFYIYGIFFRPLMEDFNWTRATTSGAFSLAVFVSGVIGIIAGRISDRIGAKKVIIFCTCLLAAGFILMSEVKTTWQFYGLYGIVIAAGVGGFWAPLVSTIARWFTARRGIITGIVSGGISFGTIILPLIVTPLIDNYSWRTAYLILGIAVFCVIMTAAQFVKPSPQAMGLRPYGESGASGLKGVKTVSFSFKEAAATRQFWIVILIYVFFGFSQLTIVVHMVPHATGLGLSALSAASILSIIGGVSLAGRILTGLIADRIRVKNAALISLTLMSVSLLWLLQADSLWKFYIFAVVFGFGYGGLSCLQALMAAELFGLASLGIITGIFSLSFNIGGAIGPLTAGIIFDGSESYMWAFMVCLIVVVIALTICFTLKPPVKKV